MATYRGRKDRGYRGPRPMTPTRPTRTGTRGATYIEPQYSYATPSQVRYEEGLPKPGTPPQMRYQARTGFIPYAPGSIGANLQWGWNRAQQWAGGVGAEIRGLMRPRQYPNSFIGGGYGNLANQPGWQPGESLAQYWWRMSQANLGYLSNKVRGVTNTPTKNLATKPGYKGSVTYPPAGKYSETWWRKNIGNEPVRTYVEAAGTTPSVGPEYPGGGYGGGYYDYGGYGGGGGGYSYPAYNNAFNQYSPGYALQSTAPMQALGVRTMPLGNLNRNYATANPGPRWLSLLVNWHVS